MHMSIHPKFPFGVPTNKERQKQRSKHATIYECFRFANTSFQHFGFDPSLATFVRGHMALQKLRLAPQLTGGRWILMTWTLFGKARACGLG